jgi:hypothetical protein
MAEQLAVFFDENLFSEKISSGDSSVLMAQKYLRPNPACNPTFPKSQVSEAFFSFGKMIDC